MIELLDDLDRRILRKMQVDAGISNADLAESVGASPASCWRRVRALEARGVLGRAVRLLNAQAVDKSLSVVCQVRMKTHSQESRGSFEYFVQQHPAVMECFSMSGEWDYLLRIVVSDVASYENFLMRELLGHESVATSASHFALASVKYTTALPL